MSTYRLRDREMNLVLHLPLSALLNGEKGKDANKRGKKEFKMMSRKAGL